MGRREGGREGGRKGERGCREGGREGQRKGGGGWELLQNIQSQQMLHALPNIKTKCLCRNTHAHLPVTNCNKMARSFSL